ncbi:oligosaccharide flippase family protein [Saccharicrinis sp. FJH54]|uniref:oligosaccharide flippase family protein n=1 Tax=Saccharicrinis sp. FJH54 TaxID=3344665 RepID=UPI0035D4D7B3
MFKSQFNTLVLNAKQILSDVGKMGFFHLLSANFFIQIITFSSGLFVAWILSPEQIGQIKVLQTYSGLAIIIAGLGFNTSTLKLCSEKRGSEETYYLFKKAIHYTVISTIVAYLIFSALAFMGLISADPIINKVLPLYFIALFPLTLNYLQISYLQALKRIKELASIQTITKLISLFLIIGLTYFFGFKGFIYSTIAGSTLTFIVMFRRTCIKQENRKKFNFKHAFRTHWFYAKFSFLANALSNISLYLDIFLLNYFISDRTELGYYSFAITLIIVLRLFTTTVQQITTPYFSERSNNKDEWKRVFKKYNRLLFLLSILIGIAAFISIKPALHLMFSGKYDNSVIYFRYLILAWFFRNMYALRGVALLGLGKINLNFYASLIALPVNSGLMYYFITQYNTIGATYGSIAGAIFSYLIMYAMFQSVLNNNLSIKRKT